MDTETGRKATRDALEEAARETGREPAVVQGNFDPRLLTDDSPMSAVNVSVCVSIVIKSRKQGTTSMFIFRFHPQDLAYDSPLS